MSDEDRRPRVLVGGGGREHAILQAPEGSPQSPELLCAPGPGHPHPRSVQLLLAPRRTVRPSRYTLTTHGHVTQSNTVTIT